MEISFSCVIPTINFQRLKMLLVTLLFFILEYIFFKQFVKLLMVKYTYLLTKVRFFISVTLSIQVASVPLVQNTSFIHYIDISHAIMLQLKHFNIFY